MSMCRIIDIAVAS